MECMRDDKWRSNSKISLFGLKNSSDLHVFDLYQSLLINNLVSFIFLAIFSYLLHPEINLFLTLIQKVLSALSRETF